ncbi:dihydroneopterin aldolase [Polluticoccus soli]|uniref:dihydroneopterin aldolase n=1 Tax=Polluticoccus soli TaxID=3034150 RepID=UPI0023E1ACC0|nr:dihydroneopterin aldolase [Flavipsychrobacter sp. JY13-12]
MLTVSLHGIRISAPYGLYAEEPVLGNDFEVDLDVFFAVADNEQWPFADYTKLNEIARNCFTQQGQLLEVLVKDIHSSIKSSFPNTAKIKVAVRKLHPPMPGDVQYSQVCYEG